MTTTEIGDSIGEDFIQIHKDPPLQAPTLDLIAFATSLQKAYSLVKEVEYRKQECEVLCEFSFRCLVILLDNYEPSADSVFGSTVVEVVRICTEIEIDMERWGGYKKALGFFRNNEIKDGIEKHRQSMSTALSLVGFAQSLTQETWNKHFLDAQENDQIMSDGIDQNQYLMNVRVLDQEKSIQKLIALPHTHHHDALGVLDLKMSTQKPTSLQHETDNTGSKGNDLLQMADVLLSFAPIPGLAAIAISLRMIYKLVKGVEYRKQECETLCDYSFQCIVIMRDRYKPNATFDMVVGKVTQIYAEIETDIKRWGNQEKGLALSEITEIPDGVAKHRRNLIQALSELGNAQWLRQDVWNQRFLEAQENDRSVLERVETHQDRVDVRALDQEKAHLPPSPRDPQIPAHVPYITVQKGGMDAGKSRGDDLLQMAEVLLSFAPIPGLAAIAISLRMVYKLVKEVEYRKQECVALCDYSFQCLLIMRDSYKPDADSTFDSMVGEVTKICTEIETDMKRWGNYKKGLGFFRNREILDGVTKHYKNLVQALSLLGLAQSLGQEAWNQRFLDAQEKDRSVLEKIETKQDQMDVHVLDLKKTMQESIALQHKYQNEAPEIQARMELFRLRAARQDTAVLPKADLDGEVQKIGTQPAHAGMKYVVWKGLWLGEWFVALKVFQNRTPRPKDAERMNRQVDLWRALKHPNILQLYGIVTLDKVPNPPIYFVSPWQTNRDVMSYLKQFTNADRLSVLHDMAMGLKYLHERMILHGGLQGSNVLISGAGKAVLSDFSFSQVLDGAAMFSQSNGPSASMRWMSPEAHNAEVMTSQSDVYAWGMTALQILSGNIPFYTIKAMGQLVVNIAIKNIKPARKDYPSDWITDRIWTLLLACWGIDPLKRPTVEQIITLLEEERKEKTGWVPPADDDSVMDDPFHGMDGDFPRTF